MSWWKRDVRVNVCVLGWLWLIVAIDAAVFVGQLARWIGV